MVRTIDQVVHKVSIFIGFASSKSDIVIPFQHAEASLCLASLRWSFAIETPLRFLSTFPPFSSADSPFQTNSLLYTRFLSRRLVFCSSISTGMSYAYLFKYIIIGDTGTPLYLSGFRFGSGF